MSANTSFSIAEMGYSLIADHDVVLPEVPIHLQPFLSSAPADFYFRVTRSTFPFALRDEDLSFQTAHWRFYQLPDRFVSRITPNAVENSIVHTEFVPGERRGVIYLDEAFSQSGRHPLTSPIFEEICITTLAQQGGMLAHASGVFHQGQVFLFLGTSGSGKTTTARLWERHGAASVLCDDRIAIRMINGEYWAFGTPWHGDHPVVTRKGGRIEKIFFIKHAPENSAALMKPVQSSAMLYARSFPPLWDPASLRTYVETSVRLAEHVPCYEYGFTPDESCVDYVLSL